MAHGLNSVLRRAHGTPGCKGDSKGGGIGSRRIFAPHFKLQVLDSYRNDADCKGNQRATARKYGIHRRQIQKWLQCETNLRSSIGGGGSSKTPPAAAKEQASLGPTRQRGDSEVEGRVPAHDDGERSPSVVVDLSPVASPLDYTMHSRSGHASPTCRPVLPKSPTGPPVQLDPAAPMDLSLKRVPSPAVARDITLDRIKVEVKLETPSPDCYSEECRSSSAPQFSPFTCSPPPSTSPSSLTCLPPPQHDIWDLSLKAQKRKSDSAPSSISPIHEDKPKPAKLFKPYLDDLHDPDVEETPNKSSPPCCSYLQPLPEGEAFFYNNNHIAPDHSYTIYELQPKSSLSYFYPLNKTGPYSTSECEPYYAQLDNALLPNVHTPLKQRQSYSLDFKLQAIESYYQDSMCRGNQRAVANKYNIHRRQVQKWLKQEDELRQRNETRHVHAVR